MESKYKNAFKIGDTFNMLTIVDNTIIMDREAKILVKCICGKQKIVSVFPLIKGRIVSCGCQMNKKQNQHPEWTGTNHISGTMIARIKTRSLYKKIDYDLTDEFLENLLINQKCKCALSGLKLDTKNMSLDRIDSSLGYIPSNVRWVHKDINIMKNSYSEEYFIFLCKKICNIPTEEVYRNKKRIKLNNSTYTLINSNNEFFTFKNKDDVKKYIDDLNVKLKANGPSKISYNSLYRNKKSKGWKLLKK